MDKVDILTLFRRLATKKKASDVDQSERDNRSIRKRLKSTQSLIYSARRGQVELNCHVIMFTFRGQDGSCAGPRD